MPKVTISSSKGLEQTSGSGLSVSDVELVRSNESITPTGGVYTVTCIASAGHTSTTLQDKYFIIYDQDGNSYGVHLDASGGGTPPTAASDADFTLSASTHSEGSSATVIAASLATDINAAANFSDEFFAKSSSETLTIYVLDAGEMTTDTEDEGDSEFTVSLADGSDGDLDEDVETSHITIGNDVADVDEQSVQLANGSSVGQRKNVIFAANTTSATINVGGAFSGGGLLLSSETLKTGLATLVWDGSAWVPQTLINAAVS
jgi:hypothetical protein